MKIISNLHLLLYYSVSWGNRTLNCPLGGGRYIHLTKETIHIDDKYNISCVFMQIILYLYSSVLIWQYAVKQIIGRLCIRHREEDYIKFRNEVYDEKEENICRFDGGNYHGGEYLQFDSPGSFKVAEGTGERKSQQCISDRYGAFHGDGALFEKYS